jgi:molecular chaperone GrpE
VIKDNRKIDSAGRPKDTGDKGASEQPKPAGAGRPDTPVVESAGSAAPPKETKQAGSKPSGGPSGDPSGGPSGGPSGDTDAKTPAPAGAAPAESSQDAASAEAKVPPALGAELESLRSELDERLRDLQRVSAEYANYRKRVERDRGVVVEQAVGAVLSALLPILDDVDRAREHGDLNGPFAAVAEQLTTSLAKFGLNAFGEKGDPFDPTRHEAVTHETSPDVTEPTCVSVMRRGYLLGDRLLRPAMVAVADPE